MSEEVPWKSQCKKSDDKGKKDKRNRLGWQTLLKRMSAFKQSPEKNEERACSERSVYHFIVCLNVFFAYLSYNRLNGIQTNDRW
jgi:hypothetical protein